MTLIEELPDLRWSALAKAEIEKEGAELVAKSHIAVQIGNVAVAGLIYQNYLASPWLWFALAEGVTMRDLIDFRKLRDSIPVGTFTGVSDAGCRRFAEFYGFRSTDVSAGGYLLMRKI